jgi:hypothetical protein
MAAIMVNGTGTFYPDSWLIENNIIANHFTSSPVALNNSVWLTGTVRNFAIQNNYFYVAGEGVRLSGLVLTSDPLLVIKDNAGNYNNTVTSWNMGFGAEPSGASYVIFTDSTYTYMVNGTTAKIVYYSTNSTKVLEYARGNSTEKAKIIVKPNVVYGSYTFLSDCFLTVCTAGETIGIAQSIYFNGANARYYLADADAETTIGNGTVAIAVSNATSGNTFLRMTEGFLYFSTWTWTASSIIYISTTSGGLTETAPSGSGDQILRMGFAWNATTIEFKVSNIYLEHS